MSPVSLAFEIHISEERRNTGNHARASIWRVWVIKAGVRKQYRDESFPHKREAVARFNLYRRTLNSATPPPSPAQFLARAEWASA
jgi:hypothetical protein